MASQQPSPLPSPSSPPPTYSTTTSSESLNQEKKLLCKPLQQNQPTSPSTTKTLFTLAFLILITSLSILNLAYQSTTHPLVISNTSIVSLFLPVVSIASITALLWQKFKSRRIRRKMLDEEQAVDMMDEDETLEEGGELYAVGWEDGSRDSREGNGWDLGR